MVSFARFLVRTTKFGSTAKFSVGATKLLVSFARFLVRTTKFGSTAKILVVATNLLVSFTKFLVNLTENERQPSGQTSRKVGIAYKISMSAYVTFKTV